MLYSPVWIKNLRTTIPISAFSSIKAANVSMVDGAIIISGLMITKYLLSEHSSRALL
jgi:hypothetical protein